MRIEQYEDKNLSQYSYLIEDDGEMILIDPSRNPQPYYDAARTYEAIITGIIETHPHADFISSHLEIHHNTGATIFVSPETKPSYPHMILQEGEELSVGKLRLKVIYTPGHSPDSISILLSDQEKNIALFTGDTLFIGDCGRPDLRENKGDVTGQKEIFAGQLYDSLHKLAALDDHIFVYPTHGAGSLCGKSISETNRSTIGQEKYSNWSLQPMTKPEFIRKLLADLPFIPEYFAYDVALNLLGAPAYQESIEKIEFLRTINSEDDLELINPGYRIVDTRAAEYFKKRRLENSVNIPEGKSFETWLGSIIKPYEKFYLAGDDKDTLKTLIERTAKIGYEVFIENVILLEYGVEASLKTPTDEILKNPEEYTIIDVRTGQEAQEKVFPHAINIPLSQLQQQLDTIPYDKPIVVHCAGGYRSAIASSILEHYFKGRQTVMDMGSVIREIIESRK